MSSWEIQKEAVRKRLLTRDHENKKKNNAKKKRCGKLVVWR